MSASPTTPAGSKMRVCFVIQHVTPGTHMDYVFEMARTLKEDEGLPLTLLIEKPSNGEVPPWAIIQRQTFTLFRIMENFFLLLRERMRGTKIFYVHYSFLSAISAGLITKLFGGQVFYWNAGMPWLYSRSWKEDWYQKLAYRLITRLVTGAEALISGYCKTYGLKPSQVTVIPNWIDTSHITKDPSVRWTLRAEYGIGETALVVLFVHKLSKRKGAHFLPEIMKQLTVPNVHLLIAGDGPLRAELEKEMDQLPIRGRVHFLGSVSRSKVQELYQAADIFIMPSEEEGSPHSLIEAMAYGVPFVAFDVGGVRETATEALSEFVVPFANVQVLCEKVADLLTNKAMFDQVRHAESFVTKRYSKPIIVARFKELCIRGTNTNLV